MTDEATVEEDGGASEDVPDACDVATRADVEATFGGTAGDGEVTVTGTCDFDVRGSDLVGDGGVSVGVSSASELDFDTVRETYTTAEPVDGLGDEAIYTSNGLYVRVGELTVRIAPTFSGFGAEEQEVAQNEQAAAIELAGRVLTVL